MNRALAILVVLLLLHPLPASTRSLDWHVEKYRHLVVSTSMQQALAPFQPFIEYFSSLYYFIPNHQVDKDFLKALIIAESAANPRARSPKDARGLTQIIYPTGLQAARELAATGYSFRYVSRNKLSNLKPNDLYDPAINLLLASYLIAKYNLKYDGRLDLVVAAWNAGEKSIKNDSPPDYRETKDLIGKVNGYFLSLLRQQNRLTSDR